MSQMLAAALSYAAKGIPILPVWHIGPGGRCGCGRDCGAIGKHPLLPNGLKGASVDPATIKQWFGGTGPEPNLAVRTGGSNGLIIIDEDQPGAILAAGFELPNGPCAATGRGRHFYLKSSNGVALASRSGVVPGVDIRADGGYAVAPPSQHASGAVYRWVGGHAIWDLDPPDLTPELIRLLTAPGPNGAGTNDHQDLFGRLRIESLLEEIAGLPADAGGRWRTLMLKLTGSLVGRGLSDDVILMVCRRATRLDLGYSHEQTDELVAGLISSTRKRWSVPPPEEDTFDQVDGAPVPTAPLRVVSGPELLALELPARDAILGPWLTSKSLAMVYGFRGLGKTYVVLGIAIAIVTGGKFLNWEAKPKRVLLIDGEMPTVVLQERIAGLAGNANLENLTVIAADLQDGVPMINLATVEGQQAIAEYVDQADAVLVDNLASLARSGDENEREPWLIVQSWLLKLRSQGKAVVIVHHAGKGGDQRGTSAREDVLDTVVKLSRPTDCQGDEGLRVEWVFAKHRGFYGADAMPLEVSLTVNQGELTWTWQPLETSLVLQVAEHLNETECSLADIARDMNLPKTTVWRLKKRAEALGLLKSKPGGQKRND